MKRWLGRSNILNLFGLVAIVYLAVIVSQTIRHNYQLNQQINTLQKQISDLNGQQALLQYEVQYYKTDAYKEKAARQNLGLMLPGESVIILPPTVTPKVAPVVVAPTTKSPSNPEQWWKFIFG